MSGFDNDNDRTVYRGVPGQEERTMIPTPGRRGAATTRWNSPQAGQATPQVQMPNDQFARGMQGAVDTQAAHLQRFRGVNPLVSSASTLLALMSKIRNTFSHNDVNGLYQRLSNEIKQFESRAKGEGERPEVVLAARYILCAALDELVLATPWGSESQWRQRTLLVAFHNEMGGGEKFFLILDRMRQTPAENLHILELMFLLLSLGYKGKYQLVQNGSDHIEQLRDELFRIIRGFRGDFERELSGNWHSTAVRRSTFINYVPFWVVASTAAALLLLAYFGFRVWMHSTSEPVQQQLNEIVQSADEILLKDRIQEQEKL